MIRINLLRTPPTRTRVWMADKSRLGLYALILLVLTFGGMGGWYWYLSQKRSSQSSVVVQLEKEHLRLQANTVEFQKYELQKNLLQERIAITERLRSSQRGPVWLMNAIIAAIPAESELWLTRLAQTEHVVTIEGRTLDVSSIGTFIANLNNKPLVKHVELGYWQEEGNSAMFELTFELCLLNCL